ncbi:MAG: DNA polymerase [Candidatus Acidiferrales bacterium]
MTRSTFINRVFWDSVRKGQPIIGFNLPFDLSRLAVRAANGRKGSWSLVLSFRKSRKTGELVANADRPRIVINSMNSKMAFIKLGSILHRDEWPKESRFLDLRTLGWAIRNEAFSLERACKGFGVEGKIKHKPTGRVTLKEIDYCRGDVAATARLLNAMKAEFDQNPIELQPEKAYSPASIAKAYLDAMQIRRPKTHFKIPNKTLGIAMQAYYGGRAECRIRRTRVPVIHTDFTSQYPTVNALLGNWDLLKARSTHFKDYTAVARKILSTVKLRDTFNPQFWKKLSFFVLLKPQNDIVPVRTVYSGKTQNIGLNYLWSKKPIWYAGPDAVASTLLNGKPPRILNAIRIVASRRPYRTQPTNLGGMVRIDPATGDFYRKVIEQRILHKRKNKPLADFLKVLANSGSYGLFVEVNTETNSREKNVRYFSGEKSGRKRTNYVEKPGAWYFPPLASLITSGGRLLLAMLEKCVQNLRGSYLFCDTDSMCIVGSKNQSLVPCVGGQFRLNEADAIRALPLSHVKAIAKKFNKLNPYNPKLVQDILKIEDVNYVDSDPSKPFRQLFGYAVSAKRYALFTECGKNISIEKASGHGLGYLFAPKERDPGDADDETEETPEWVLEAWEYLLRREFKFQTKQPSWLRLPAMMRMVMTSPNVLKNRRPDWLAPFNFFFFPLLSDLGGYPFGFDKTNFQFITPPEMDRKKWGKLKGINLLDGRTYQISMVPDPNQDKATPDSFRIILRQYFGKPEVKSLAPDGSPCDANTAGLLRRSVIVAGNVIPVGKETDRHWEQGEDPSIIDFDIQVYGPSGKLVVADPFDRKKWARVGVRRWMRETKLTQKAVYAIISGKGVRPQSLATFRSAAELVGL